MTWSSSVKKYRNTDIQALVVCALFWRQSSYQMIKTTSQLVTTHASVPVRKVASVRYRKIWNCFLWITRNKERRLSTHSGRACMLLDIENLAESLTKLHSIWWNFCINLRDIRSALCYQSCSLGNTTKRALECILFYETWHFCNHDQCIVANNSSVSFSMLCTAEVTWKMIVEYVERLVVVRVKVSRLLSSYIFCVSKCFSVQLLY